MISRSIHRCCTYVLSPLEVSLGQFVQGRSLSGGVVSEFIRNCEKPPVVETLQDVVYLTRLVQGHVQNPAMEIRSFLQERTNAIMQSLDEVSSTHLSVLISCLSDSPWLDGDVVTQAALREILTRETNVPRVVGRICKGLSVLVKRKANMNDTEMLGKAQELINNIEVSEIQINDFLEILNLQSLCVDCIRVPDTVLTHGALLVPFMTDAQARRALGIVKTGPIADEIKRKLVRAKPRRAKTIEVEQVGPAEVSRPPHFEYVRKLDLR